MGDELNTTNLPVEIQYPNNFEIPGPATQADAMLQCFEYWLVDYEDDYNNGPTNGLEPEEWVELRELYSHIHWMYNHLVGEAEGKAEAD